jgi:hypothetical protein
MKRVLLLSFVLFTYVAGYCQGGTGPVQSCASPIPEICNGSLYPAAISGTATAPIGTNLNCGFSAITEYGSFYFLRYSLILSVMHRQGRDLFNHVHLQYQKFVMDLYILPLLQAQQLLHLEQVLIVVFLQLLNMDHFTFLNPTLMVH